MIAARAIRRSAVLLLALLGVGLRGPISGVRAASPDSAPPLAAPAGSVINVANVAQLNAAVSALGSNQTIVIAPGTYVLTSTLFLNRTLANATIRGATNNRNDVVLVGQGMGVASANVPYGIWTGGGVTGLTIANLTIRDVYRHALMFNAATESPRVYNVRLLDAGEQLLKSNPDGTGGGVDNGIVEYSVIEYSNTAPSNYTNGVDVHTGQNWIIRHNLFRRIRSPQGSLAGPAILMWNGSSGTLVEGNTFVDCHRDIALGLIERTPDDHAGGVVRNNFIVRNPGMGGDVGIGVMDSPNTKVLHNTIFLNGQYPNAIEYRFAGTTGVTVAQNLSDRVATARDGATGSVQNNVWSAVAGWFVNVGAGDLHLTTTATPAINTALTSADVATDWDGVARPSTGRDLGADELGGGSAPDVQAPSAAMTSPAAGSSVAGAVALTATASDNVGVVGVSFFANGSPVASEDAAAPYTAAWNTTLVPDGAYQLVATARDAAGNSVTTQGVWVTVRNAPTRARGDLNGDAKPDLLFRHTNGSLHAWFMSNGSMIGHSPLTPSTVDPLWTVVGLDDFSGDLVADLLWQHATSGQVYLWSMSGAQLASGTWISTATSSKRIVATGDLDGDGHADIVWQTASGQTWASLMNGPLPLGDGPLVPDQIGAGWLVAGAADLNGDSRADLVWRNPVTGAVAVWYMNGRTMQESVPMTPAAAQPAWRIAALADFNADGRADLVWQHADGRLHAWYLDGAVMTSSAPITPGRVDPAWRVVGGS